MTSPRNLSILPAGVFAVFFMGCQLFSTTDEVSLLLPSEPWASSGEMAPASWTIHWFSDFGRVERRMVKGGQPLFFDIPRENPLIVVAWPNTISLPASWSFKPAGFVQGTGQNRESSKLNWQDGFVAELLCELAENGVNMLKINVNRLVQTVLSRSSFQPWNIDRRELIADILDGSLWVYSVKLMETYEIHLPLPPGSWDSTYPPDPPIIAGESGWNGYLAHGLHCFIRSSDNSVATVWIDSPHPPVFLLTTS